MNHYASILTASVLLLGFVDTHAQGTAAHASHWGLCAADPLESAIPTDDPGAPDASTTLTADVAESSDTSALLQGNVRVSRGDQYLTAPIVELDRVANRVVAKDGAVYGSPQLVVSSERAELDLDDQTGVFDDAEYFLPEQSAQGSAQQVRTDRSRRTDILERATFSTCIRGDEFWQLRARRLEVDEDTDRAVARDITVAIEGVPLLYLPYLSFPTSGDRQSGFLFPEVGYSNRNGFELAVPYYWNVAPDRDMTITPKVFAKRGAMLGTEYRFLNPKSTGAIELEYMPHDSDRDGDARGAVRIVQGANPLPNTFSSLLFQYVSDDDFIDDFGNNIDLLSPSYLERNLQSAYYGTGWNTVLRVQGFQTIDPVVFPTEASKPYDRLPQVLFQGAWPQGPRRPNYALGGEVVNFDHPSLVDGGRLDLLPEVSMPLVRPQGYINPKLGFRYTTYQLANNTPGLSDTPSRALPIVSLDSGLNFERSTQLFGNNTIQTLEPRLFYLYVPFRDQDEIPVFDSTQVDLSYAWLFLDNRFTGADRVGDANQITTALTTRLLGAEDGREQLRASVGQIQYFEDRQVELPGTTPTVNPTASRSPLIAEAVWSMTSSWFLRGFVHWDTENNSTRRRGFDLRHHEGDRIFNFAYRLSQQDSLEQVDVSMLWPISSRWRGVGRWNYSLEQGQTIDAIAGFEYDECCWALRFLARSRRDQPDAPSANNSVLFQLELKGLSGVGQRIDRVLQSAIFGYQPTRY